ncbi:hypothetical protein HF086_000310 [Spodoptera exigua]|uniref:Endonuclease/exonuclease/phosphatase domain-containing protein n=1 Tax=Spodoptera exigua TaxID=7107 RepID=A0A922M8I5_SPOEX|nr:hypothetical protein HF086_000310 [Spodoptera exigua]
MVSGTDEVQAYLQNLFPDGGCTVEELKAKGDYRSFKIGVPPELYENCVSPNIWPTNARVKEWFFVDNQLKTCIKYSNPASRATCKQSFSCIYQNVRGLNTKLNFLRQNLLMINCDAIAVTETFLTNSVLDSELTSNGWSVLRRDRVTGAGGGVMLVARPGVKVTRCCDLETTNGEDLWVRCVTEHASFYICVVYIHPRASDELYMSWFLKVESFIDSLNGDVIIVGDLNLNPVYTSSSILSYYCYFLTVNGLKERNEVKNAYGGQLDVVLVSDCIDHVEVTEVDGGGLVPKRDAYHPPLEVVFSSNYHSIEKAHPSNIDTDKDWNFPKGNYKHMYYLIAEASWQEVFEAGDVDTALDCFYDVLYTIFDKCVPKKKDLGSQVDVTRFGLPLT